MISEDINTLIEDHYDISLIVEIYNDGKLYTINDYLYYSYVDENSAKVKYDELYNIIDNDNVDDTINSIKALKKA